MKTAKTIVAILAVLIVITAGIGIYFVANPTHEDKQVDNTITWKAVQYDGYNLEGIRDTAKSGDITTDLSVYDITLRPYKDSAFVSATYLDHEFLGIYTNGYMEIKGYDGQYESIMYGVINPENSTEMYVVYIGVNPSDLTDRNSSIYCCSYTTDGHIPNFDCKMTKSITGWTCKSTGEMICTVDSAGPHWSYDKLVAGSAITVSTYSDETGIMYGQYEGRDTGTITKFIDYSGVMIPKQFSSTIGCDVILIDEECDIWLCRFSTNAAGHDQLVMSCTYGNETVGKSIHRIYSAYDDVSVPTSDYDISGTWKEVKAVGIDSKGNSITEPNGIQFTIKNHTDAEASSDRVLYSGVTNVNTYKGTATGYLVPGSGWMFLKLNLYENGSSISDHFDYCTVYIVESGGKTYLEVTQNYWAYGIQYVKYSTFEKLA